MMQTKGKWNDTMGKWNDTMGKPKRKDKKKGEKFLEGRYKE
jgi:hypothetical protein